MARRIRKLDNTVIGQIAAGEVVERPAYAIKELVENSLDAGATSVTVEIKEGGVPYFRVTDNGCGIAREDLAMAFERHATSKIRTAEELIHVATLGFRGEALASIAAVARVRLTTRTKADASGTVIICEGGVIQNIQDAASPEGTSIVVRDLFFNTPARLKFLKKPATEAGLVAEMMMRMILSQPGIAFRFIANGRQVYFSPGDGDVKTAMYSVLGRGVMQGLIPVHGSAAGCAFTGLVGVGELARTNRTNQSFFLNGRYIKSLLLAQALEDACRELVTVGHYPICAIHLTMAYDLVDINVHPNKLEARFQNEKILYDSLAAALRDCLTARPIAPPAMPLPGPKPTAQEQRKLPRAEVTVQEAARALVKPQTATDAEQPRNVPANTAQMQDVRSALPKLTPPRAKVSPSFWQELTPKAKVLSDSGSLSAQGTMRQAPPVAPVQPEQTELPQEAIGPKEPVFRLLGTVFDTYILLEVGDSLYVVDQHAAHERILYDRFMAALDQSRISQQILPPIIVPVTLKEAALLDAYADEVKAAGFDIEPFGERTIQVRAVPVILGVPSVQGFFEEFLSSLDEMKRLPTLEKRRDAMIQLACKKAVKGGDKLSERELKTLLKDTLTSQALLTCPHGRPVCLTLTRAELEKHFHRA